MTMNKPTDALAGPLHRVVSPLAASILLPPGGKTQTDVWGTPQWLFDSLNKEFGFTLDPCTDGTNAKCERFFTEDDSGLAKDWGTHSVFMNPPYSECEAWMGKAYAASQRGATVVCLVPARTDTNWWHRYAMKGEIRFLRGRLKFGEATDPAPFPSAIVVFRPWEFRLVSVG
jgi:site-specific DNA-methyltransferase (adenine-specific)